VAGFHEDIVALARSNDLFRQELTTSTFSQLVLMSIEPGSEIGEEVHDDVDQVLVFVEGEGEAVIEGQTAPVTPNQLVFVPAGTLHNFRNTGSGPLKLYTVYSPPEHAPGTVHRTKAEADEWEAQHPH
jgi:mannose-6-phosphate isomerase-like protein (cupin superfamily)